MQQELNNTFIQSSFITYYCFPSKFVVSERSCLCLNNEGNIFCRGTNTGFSETNSVTSNWVKINSLDTIKMIGLGYHHYIYLDYNNNVYTCGSNSVGQLGFNDIRKIHIPQKLNLINISMISSGNFFIICLSNDGLLYSFGSNLYGQLGNGTKKQSNIPVQIPDINNVIFIECGGYHALCKTYDNNCYTWGYGSCGRLGQNNEESYTKPKLCELYPKDVVTLKGNEYNSYILTALGQLYSCGKNTNGELGIDNNTDEFLSIPMLVENIPIIKKIDCGSSHCMCIDINDNLWVFGANEYGQLGLGDYKNRYKPIKHELKNVIDISHGGYASFVRTVNNEIYAFGRNYRNTITNTKNNNYNKPILVHSNSDEIWGYPFFKSRQKSARK